MHDNDINTLSTDRSIKKCYTCNVTIDLNEVKKPLKIVNKTLDDIEIKFGYLDYYIDQTIDLINSIKDIKERSLEAIQKTDGIIERDNKRFVMDVRNQDIFECIRYIEKSFDNLLFAKKCILVRE
jgi:uncharacterized protein YoxC